MPSEPDKRTKKPMNKRREAYFYIVVMSSVLVTVWKGWKIGLTVFIAAGLLGNAVKFIRGKGASDDQT